MKDNKSLKLLKKSARKRNILVDLTTEHYRNLLSLGCSYCGKDLSNENGYCLDRLDNDVGYTNYNCLPSCWDCNRAKGKMDFLSFIEWAKKVVEKHEKDLTRINNSDNFNMKKNLNILENSSQYRNSEKIKIKGIRG